MTDNSEKSIINSDHNDEFININNVTTNTGNNSELINQLYKINAIFQSTNDAIYVIGIQDDMASSKIIKANAAACKMLGYSKQEFTNLAIKDIDPNYRKSDKPDKHKNILKNGHETFESVNITKEGEKIPVEVNAHLFELDKKKLILSIARNIRDKKKAIDQAEQIKQDWNLIFQAIGHPVLILDPQNNILNVNKAAIEATGMDEKELLGKKCWKIFHKTEHPPNSCPMQKLLNSSQLETSEMEVEALGGYYLVSVTPVLDEEGNLEKIIHIATDISDRKEAEKRYRTLVNNAQDGIYIINSKEGFQYVNPAFESITGYSAEKIYSADFSFWKLIHPDDREKVKMREQARIKEKDIDDLYDFRLVSKNGDIKTVEVQTVGIGEQDVRVMGILRDITERKKIEEELRLQNARNRNLIENEVAGIGISDFDENLISVNQTFANMLGYTIDELEGMNLSELTNNDEYRKYNEENKKRKEGKTSVYESQLTSKDGSKINVIINASPHKNSEGKIIGTVGVIIDITEKKKAEQAARESENWFKKLSDTISAAIFIYRKGNLIYVNRTAEYITGYSQKELLNMKLLEIIHPDYKKLVSDRLNARKESDDVSDHFEMKIQKKDGSPAWVDFTTGNIDWKGKPARIGTVTDITDRKLAEENLRENEKKLKMITENTNSLVAIMDQGGIFEYISPSYENILGYLPQELIGQSGFELIPPESRSKLFSILEMSSKREIGRITKLEYKIVDKDGDIHYLEGSFDSIRDESGNIQKLINISEDITQIKKQEQERKQLEQQLQQAQKMESIGRLAGGVAHDLNNILTPILGYSELLDNSFTDGDERKNLVKNIIDSGDRAKNIVSQLLAFSRKQSLEVKSVDLNDIIKRFKKLLRRTIKENIDINLNLDRSIPKIEADVGQIEQVIMNLCVNAQDAMPDGGRLTIETNITELDEEYIATHQDFEPGEYVSLTISDTGCGMEKEITDQIFEPFFSTKGDQGTGLGLATVYGIVKQHHGDIHVYSEINKGTTFRIYLPTCRVDKIEDIKKQKNRAANNSMGNETILLVEDDAQVRTLANQILKNSGYRVYVRENGKEALKLINHFDDKIDLLLTDVIMPEMSGKELYNRAVADLPDLKVLYISGYTEDVMDYHGILEEGINFMQKPFSVLKMATRVREILDQ